MVVTGRYQNTETLPIVSISLPEKIQGEVPRRPYCLIVSHFRGKIEWKRFFIGTYAKGEVSTGNVLYSDDASRLKVKEETRADCRVRRTYETGRAYASGYEWASWVASPSPRETQVELLVPKGAIFYTK
jgi:hypothetical protein